MTIQPALTIKRVDQPYIDFEREELPDGTWRLNIVVLGPNGHGSPEPLLIQILSPDEPQIAGIDFT